MAPHTTLVERWRSQLAENQRLMAEGPPHRRWVHQIYIRVLRFLLSCYGGGQWRSDSGAGADDAAGAAVDSAPHAEPVRMAFENHTDGTLGAAPKSAERIRGVLRAVHAACEDVAKPGPLAETGIAADDWIAVASESGLVSPVRCVRLLRRQGLEARKRRCGDDVIVEVRAGQREEALEHLHTNDAYLRISSRRKASRRMAGLVAGLALSFPVSIAASVWMVRLAWPEGTKSVPEHQILALVLGTWILGSTLGAGIGMWFADRIYRV